MALWTPAAISTALWLDAADSSTLFDAVSGGSSVVADGAVARWADKSGSGRNATQATLEARPLRKVASLNGKDVLQFDGSNDFFSVSGLDIFRNVPGVTAFAVRKLDATGSDRTIFTASVAGGTAARFVISQGGIFGNNYLTGVRRLDSDAGVFANDSTPKTDTAFAIQAGTVNYASGGAGAILSYANGAIAATASLAGSGNTSNTDSQSVRIGATPAGAQFFNGPIAEVVAIPFVATLEMRQLIEGYLAWKWGLQGNLPADHPYKNAAPTTDSGIIPILRQHYAAQGAR